MTTTVVANPAINNTNVGELMGMMGKFAIAEFNERSFSRMALTEGDKKGSKA